MIKLKQKEKIKSQIQKQSAPQKTLTFYCDDDRKKSIEKYLVDSRRALRAARVFGNVMLIGGIAIAAAYILFYLALNSWSIGYVNGAPVTDYGTVIVTGLLFFLVGLTFFFSMRLAVYMLTRKNIRNRKNEKLEIFGTELRYTFQTIKWQPEKSVIEIQLGTPEDSQIQMEYMPKETRLTFNGEMKETYYTVEDGEKVIQSKKIDKLVLYDYFDPSIHLILVRMGYCFIEPVVQLQEKSAVLKKNKTMLKLFKKKGGNSSEGTNASAEEGAGL